MFTGIIETLGKITQIVKDGSNVHLTISSDISKEAYIDQSISHNGVCLTVVSKTEKDHTVTAIHETMIKSNLGTLSVGDHVNLERAMPAHGRMDGHIVQGHVDGISICENIQDQDGSWVYSFSLEEDNRSLIVEKGSICINGVSLTVIDLTEESFSVAIIPYTLEHTTFRYLEIGDEINIEYDIIGKYVSRYLGTINKVN